jgi:hypothetical protein
VATDKEAMGNRIRTRLIAVCLVATAMAVSSGYDPCGLEASELSPRLVRIDMAAQPPLPISHLPMYAPPPPTTPPPPYAPPPPCAPAAPLLPTPNLPP